MTSKGVTEKERHKKIMQILEESQNGTTTSVLSEKLEVTRQTIAKDLEVLRWKTGGKVVKQVFGVGAIYHHKKNYRGVPKDG